MESYVNQVIEIGQKWNRTGFKVDDQWTGLLLLTELSKRFEQILSVIGVNSLDTKINVQKAQVINRGKIRFSWGRSERIDTH